MGRILIVDDEPSLREFLAILLRKAGHEIALAESGATALEMFEDGSFDLVITDLKMPGKVDGIQVLQQVREIDAGVQVIVITAFATTETAIEAMKLGAYDYVTKPFKVDEIQVLVTKALEKRKLLRENVLLRTELQEKYRFGNLVGKSPVMQDLFKLIQRVANTRASVLVQGESGTGKELVARAIHYNSPRKDLPFVTVNCGAIPESLIESELFGHMRGSFTGAHHSKPGLFQEAHGGSIFLDEIGELPPLTQVKLLRVLQDGSFKRVGDVKEQEVDARVIAASNKVLADLVEAGTFREDLFFRLNVITIEIPPLRDRRDDVPLLATHFLKRFAEDHDRPPQTLSKEAMDLLLGHHYAGNVRELENIIARAVALEPGQIISPEALPPSMLDGPGEDDFLERLEIPQEGLDAFLDRVERRLLRQALEAANGVRKRAAELLGISFRSVRYRLQKHELDLDDQ